MNDSKIRVGVLFGGRSAEHDVSIQSARNIIKAIDRNKYHPVPIYIDRQGRWSDIHAWNILNSEMTRLPSSDLTSQTSLCLTPEETPGRFLHLSADGPRFEAIDVVFPVLHGPFGEDGTIQGLLKLAGIPWVGADVLGSALGMDKDVMKRLLRASNLPTARHLTLRRWEMPDIDQEAIIAGLGMPLFVKPANLGSSVGIEKVKDPTCLLPAIMNAFQYDEKILIEESVVGREIEVSVLGNDHPISSLPGEILPRHEFYSYTAKYLDHNGADFMIPAPLDQEVQQTLQDMAIRTFQVLECSGMARVDFFLCQDRDIVINEINTIPGFTNISMYPRLWEVSGISQPDLIDRLIRLALERHQRLRSLTTERGDQDG